MQPDANNHAADDPDGFIESVREYYDSNPDKEWDRLEDLPEEFELTMRMLKRHIKKGDRVLDIGGGPGRYSIELAKMGCDVVLLDLSEGLVKMALEKAKESGIELEAHVVNCLDIGELDIGKFDHVLIMGPLYHLVYEHQRIRTVELALDKMKDGGMLYASFKLNTTGIVGILKGVGSGNIVSFLSRPGIPKMIDALNNGTDFVVDSFGATRSINVSDVEPFMSRFPMEKVSLFGMQGVLASHVTPLKECSREEYDAWMDLSERLLEARDLLGYSQKVMYIGRKI